MFPQAVIAGTCLAGEPRQAVCVTDSDARSLVAAAGDLIVGSSCAGCAMPGLSLCDGCRSALRPVARCCWPTPCPAEFLEPTPLTPWSAAPYSGILRKVLLAYKEDGRDGLAETLVPYLMTAIESATVGGPGRWTLVPMASRRAAVRARGYDPVLLLTRIAARRFRHAGQDVILNRALRHRRRVEDQAGLGADARYRNLSGALRCAGSSWPADRGVILVDDVMTTGATLAAAAQALRTAGAEVRHAAIVAATRRDGAA